ncbi:hypothetical protein QA612_16840 [Evansella sp. AB-P1]|uniref:UPF0738 family protein n=1 Tax=Evansella sp. AB-P1 TaxID=3037653 RepID=UPI00241FDAC9|nr:hypothetical protein [Evansella sp. AB-P1]MDG5789126.1 hypothetical protein [Evansella sp. AB-P1]
MNGMEVEKIIINEQNAEAVVSTNETKEYIKKLKPQGQLLVDSDNKTFVYILEDENSFVHLRFSIEQWENLNTLKEKEIPLYVVLTSREDQVRIELVKFLDELHFVLDNIKGNSNYGKEMVDAVEQYFKL